MENQHPQAAEPELAVNPELEAGQNGAEPEGGGPAKGRHPRTLVSHLARVYPKAFSTDGRKVRPLAVGILKELQAARAGEEGHGLSMQELRRALRFYTQGAAYHRAVARGEARINLQGEPVGEVSEEQKAHAEARLAELAPKLPKRPPKTEQDKAEKAPPRRPRPAKGTQAVASAKGRKPRRAKEAPRSEPPARQDQPAQPAPSVQEKLDLLLQKFGGK